MELCNICAHLGSTLEFKKNTVIVGEEKDCALDAVEPRSIVKFHFTAVEVLATLCMVRGKDTWLPAVHSSLQGEG